MATTARTTPTKTSTKTAARIKSPPDSVESLGALLTPDYVPMRQMSGRVTGVWGQAFVRKADGTLKALSVGEELVKGDVVMTSQNGLVQLNVEGSRLARLPNIDSLERVLVAVDAGDAAPAAGFASGGTLGPGYRVDRMIEVVGGNEYTFDGVTQAGSLVGPNDVDNFVSRVASVEPGGPGASDDGVPEGTTAPNTLVYTVTLTGLSSTALTLPFTVGGGSAAANDYGTATFSNGVVNNGNGTITIPGGVSNFTISIPTVADGVVEDDETLPLTVDGITGTGTIENDDSRPTAVADSFTVNEDGSVNVPVLANDSDLDGDSLTVTQVNGIPITAGGPAVAVTNGSVSLNAAGELVLAPDSNYNGPISFSYTVSDPHGNTATTTASGTVAAVNDAPTATADSFSTNEDTAVTVAVLANDTDIDGDSLTVTQVNGSDISAGGAPVAVTHGTVTLTANGELLFTPALNYYGPASFTYTVSDGNGATATATVSGTVVAVNDPPAAVADSFTTNEDTAVTVAVLANDSDADGDTLTVTQVNGSAITAGGAAVAVTNGSVVLTSAGELVFTPAANYSGPASFSYTVADGTGLTSTANVTGTVTAVPDAPLAQPDSFTTNEDTAVTVAVLANDSDADGDTLTVTQVNGSAITAGGAAVAVTNGSVVLTSAGELVFTPAANYSGPASFSYTVADGTGLTSTADVTGTVAAVNDPPVNSMPTSTTALAMNEDGENSQGTITGPIVFSSARSTALSIGDVDSGDTLTTVITVTQGSFTVGSSTTGVEVRNNGSAAVTLIGTAAAITAALEGSTYVNAADYNGSASLTVRTTDSSGAEDTDSTTLTVHAVQDAVLDSAITNEGQAIAIDVLGNDSYEDSGALITAVNGQAISTGQSVTVANGTVTLNSAGTLSFTPSSGYSNTAETPTTFTYTVTAGGKTEAAMVAVQVVPAADLGLSANGYWTFNAGGSTTANEQSSTQVGTLSGGASIGAGSHDGNALVLNSSDGSNDFLALDSAITSALVGGSASGQATLSFWINTTQRGSSNGYSSPSVIGNSASGNNDIQWGWINSNGQIGIARGSANTSVSDTVVADGNWHQVAISYDFDAETANIYVDGVLEYSGDLLADSVVTNLAGLGVTAGQSGALSTYLNGQLDDVRIYDRVLTHSEVSEIYISEGQTSAAGAVTVDSVNSDGSVLFSVDGGTHTRISLTGAPAGAVLTDDQGHSLTLTSGSGVIDNPGNWNLDQLKLSHLGGISALVSIESTQSGGTLANATLNIVAAHHATPNNETLTGGTGTDVFAWSLGDAGSDRVQGFEALQPVTTGGDVLDLRDLLSAENESNLENYLSFEASGSSTVIHISTQGQFSNGNYDASKENATITLSDTSLASDLGLGSSASDAQLITKLLEQGKLLVDNG